MEEIHLEDVYAKQGMVDSLIESNAILQEEVNRLRTSNKVLRTVHKALRSANESLRQQVELAKFNDDVFKRFCEGEFDSPGEFDGVEDEFDAKVTSTEEGGLSESET